MERERVISLALGDQPQRSVEETGHLSHRDRLSLLEDMRREMAVVTGHEYLWRLRRALEVAEQGYEDRHR